jgi:hypothetical protein
MRLQVLAVYLFLHSYCSSFLQTIIDNTMYFLGFRTEEQFTLFKYFHDIVTKYCVHLPICTLHTSDALKTSVDATSTHTPIQYNNY